MQAGAGVASVGPHPGRRSGVAAAGVAHAGVDGVAGVGQSSGGEVADAGGGAGDEDDGHQGVPFVWVTSTRRMRSSPGFGATPPQVEASVLEVISHSAPSGATSTVRMRPYSPR